MAVLMMMAHQNKNNTQDGNPTFHDFLGMISCASDSPVTVYPKQNRFSEASASLGGASSSSGGGGTHAPVSTTSDLASDRLTGNLSEGVPLRGPKSDFSGPEISNRFMGKKRSNSDSDFMGSTRDKMPQIGPDSLESSHLMKLIRTGVAGERLRRSHDDEMFFAMQPPRQTSNSKLMLQPPVGSRPDSNTSKRERATLINSGPTSQYQSRLGQCQFATHMDKDFSNSYSDANTGPPVITQPAADEGSRTGIKGSGILSCINASSGVLDRLSSKVQLGSKSNSENQIADPESSNPPSRHGLISAGRQMTIFYDGQAHVFDEVQRNKADVIMGLAGSNGGSWSTSYSSKSNLRPPPQGESEGLPQELRGRLSMPGNSSHGFNKGVESLATANDPMSLSSSGI